MKLLEGKTALISGASRGIGLAIAEKFAQNGALRLFLLARSIENLKSIKTYLENEYNIKVDIFQTDVSVREEVVNTIGEIKKQKYGIDILVNNAGVMYDGILKMVKPENIRMTFETNVYGTIFLTQHATSSMITKKTGSIINISSILGINGTMGNSVYSASKSALVGFTKSLSKEYAPLNIRVNAIAPGYIETDMISGINPIILESIGMKRSGKPEEVANLALFLASDMSCYITGQIIGIDGGMII